MKRFIAAGLVAFFTVAVVSSAMAGGGGFAIPNPNTGEVVTIGAQNDDPSPAEPASDASGPFGSAPQSGDGIPDGSGLNAPNGPNTPK